MSYYRTPFDLFDEFVAPTLRGRQVYVVSDAQYKELQAKQAKDDIAVLENRLQCYEEAADKLRANITQLQTEHGLLPEAKAE